MKAYKIVPDLEIYSNVKPLEFKSKYEAEIVLQTLRHLKKISLRFYDEFSIVILLNNGVDVKKWDLHDLSDNKKVFIIFDEHGRIPLELIERRSDIIFHAHLSFSERDRKYSNLFHYPLGCNSFVPEMNYVALSERKLNVFFSGNLHVGRKKLYQELAHLPFLPFPVLVRIQKFLKLNFDNRFPSSYIRFTDGFSRGFSFDDYANYLNNSKIVISPPGISNPECFRHYEGLRAGCVVITESVPTKPQLEGSPVIEVKNWSNGFRIIEDLLKDPVRLDTLSRESYAWYRNHLSPQPIAQYILEKVKSLNRNVN